MTGFSEEPSAPYRAKLDKASFFAWVQRQEGGRYELKNGEIIMHARSTGRHARLMVQFGFSLSEKLDRDIWAIAMAQFAVEIGETVRYPDVLLERFGGCGDDMSTDRPVVVVEILSPTSVERDFGPKLAEYTSLASLECYIVASQDEPRVWIWQRDAETREFTIAPHEIGGRTASIDIAALGISLPLAEIYRGIAEPKFP